MILDHRPVYKKNEIVFVAVACELKHCAFVFAMNIKRITLN